MMHRGDVLDRLRAFVEEMEAARVADAIHGQSQMEDEDNEILVLRAERDRLKLAIARVCASSQMPPDERPYPFWFRDTLLNDAGMTWSGCVDIVLARTPSAPHPETGLPLELPEGWR